MTTDPASAARSARLTQALIASSLSVRIILSDDERHELKEAASPEFIAWLLDNDAAKDARIAALEGAIREALEIIPGPVSQSEPKTWLAEAIYVLRAALGEE